MIPPQAAGSGCSVNSNSVTTPKSPPPPRSAQNSSGSRCLRGSHHGAVGEGDLGRDEVVEGQAVQAHQVADPSAQGQARDPGRVVGAAGHRQPVRGAGRVDTAPRRSAADPDVPRLGIDLYPAQQPQIDHQAVFAHRVTGHAVAAAADRRRETLVLRPGDRRGDVVAAGAARDHRRVAIGHRVECRAGDVVGRVVGNQHRATQRTLQPRHRRRHPSHRPTLSAAPSKWTLSRHTATAPSTFGDVTSTIRCRRCNESVKPLSHSTIHVSGGRWHRTALAIARASMRMSRS